jgi:hypothetical protein
MASAFSTSEAFSSIVRLDGAGWTLLAELDELDELDVVVELEALEEDTAALLLPPPPQAPNISSSAQGAIREGMPRIGA